MSGQRKRTNQNQFQKLVEIMEKHPDLAKGMAKYGSTKRNQKEFWQLVADELNCLGPPSRDGKEWHKVWLDYKLKLKKKLAENKCNITATGGGPYQEIALTPLEQAVDDLLCLSNIINPQGSCYGPSTSTAITANNQVEKLDEDMNAEENNITVQPKKEANNPTCSSSRNRMDLREDDRLKILKQQTQTQENLVEVAKAMEKHLSEIARYTRMKYELLRDKENRNKKENEEENLFQ